MAEAEASRSPLGALLSGVAQEIFYRNSDVTEEVLRSELYPEATRQDFKALYDKMKALLKVRNTPESGRLLLSGSTSNAFRSLARHQAGSKAKLLGSPC